VGRTDPSYNVAFFLEIVLLACSLVPLVYRYALALDYQDNLKQSRICKWAELNQVIMWLSFLKLSFLLVV
jgi:hypothetical protein